MEVQLYMYVVKVLCWIGNVVLLWGWSRKAFPSPCLWAAS